ncbi:DUF6249 domain-containing protein [Reichenbachiella versicolor]|uniref:DUF6249 domain-containing protein n=1 Tax=Reichenbachiella versicolor TaxID=1821036 RepID=UPI000D6DFDBE|nr:DUF6249 domain-containing protein [Reichenbachiella versicolor]
MENAEHLIPFVGIFAIFILPAIVLGIIFFNYHKNKSRERMAMIEKGMDLTEIYRLEAESKNRKVDRTDGLQKGMIAAGVGLGLFVGNLFKNIHGFNSGVTMGASIAFFVGMAFILHYIIVGRKKQKEEQDQ